MFRGLAPHIATYRELEPLEPCRSRARSSETADASSPRLGGHPPDLRGVARQGTRARRIDAASAMVLVRRQIIGERPTPAAVTGLVLALLGPPALATTARWWGGLQPSMTVQVVGQTSLVAMAVAVLGVLVRWQRQPLRAIGLRRPDAWTPVVAVLVVLISLSLLPIVSDWLMQRLALGGFATGVASLAAQPTWWRVCVALTSGPIEELLYRGYAVEQFSALAGRRWAGGVLAALGFGLAHIPFWGPGPALAADLPFGVVMVLAYVWRHDLVATSAAHSILLLIALLGL